MSVFDDEIDIAALIRRGADKIHFERTGHGALYFTLPGRASNIPADILRKALLNDRALLQDFTERFEQKAAELFAPEPVDQGSVEERSDLQTDHEEWVRVLDAAATGSLDNVRPLLELWRDSAVRTTSEEGSAQEGADSAPVMEDSDSLIRLRDGVASVTAALEEQLPRAQRRAESVMLKLSGLGEAEQSQAQWMTDQWSGDAVPLFHLMRHRFSFVGGYRLADADLIARCAIAVMAERSTPLLPGFAYALQPRRRVSQDLILLWQNPRSVNARTVSGRSRSFSGSDHERMPF